MCGGRLCKDQVGSLGEASLLGELGDGAYVGVKAHNTETQPTPSWEECIPPIHGKKQLQMLESKNLRGVFSYGPSREK